MEFRHGVVNKGIIDDLSVFGSGVDQRCRGDIVDKSWDAAGIVVDEGFGIGKHSQD